ncbi:MAG TPA: butyrate kinase [Bacteroidales bacterium]|nr:butyrate kinase [Bacteroidales bacterium]
MNKYRILAVNPGSTSTKIAVYENETNVFLKNIKHTADELAEFKDIASQDNFRKSAILRELKEAGQDINTMDIVVGRGGLVKFIPSGVYQVNEAMISDLHKSPMGEHASNLGGLIAHDLVQSMNNVKAYIADPVVVDELEDIARITGHPNFERVSIFHALNQKAIARKFASEIDAKYENLNLIVVHLGGGISVGAHLQGKVIDVNNALNGEGPFSPERTGTLPAWQLADYCLSGKAEKSVIKKMITGKGGFVAYLNTNDAYAVEMRAKEGDEKAQFISDAMAYQVSKEIGAMATVLKGIVDGILLTGGIAYNKQFCSFIEQMVGFIAPVKVYAGEDEMMALALNGLMVLRGEIEEKVYK